MGPELGFGWTLGDDGDENIVLIKIAWGGRSLAVDFRPPSSGGTTGLYYESMLATTFKTLSRLSQLFPDYNNRQDNDDTDYGNAKIGHEIAGFAWHQGWNDGCDFNMTAEYESNLANLIRDVRTDLGVPDLPVSIGVSGMNGWKDPPSHDNIDEPPDRRTAIIAAQFAVANATLYPEFKGTVASVETRSFHRPPKPASPGDQVYHWNNNCESYWLIGKAMGQAMINLIRRNNKLKL